MMSNHSAQYPQGYLDKETFKSFFAVSGKSGGFKYQPGYERIPDNWYRRAIGDDYTIPGYVTPLPTLDTGLGRAHEDAASCSTSSNSPPKIPASSPSAAIPAPLTPTPPSTSRHSPRASSTALPWLRATICSASSSSSSRPRPRACSRGFTRMSPRRCSRLWTTSIAIYRGWRVRS